MLMSNEKENQKRYGWIALALGLALLTFCHWPELTRPYCIYPDVTFQYFYSSFTNDPALRTQDNVSAYSHQLLGWLHSPFWYMMTSLLVGVMQSVKNALVALSFIQGMAVLMVLLAMYRQFRPNWAGWAGTVSFMVFILSMDSLYGGMGRGFGLLVTLIFFYAYLRRNLMFLSLGLVCSAGFYLPATLPMLILHAKETCQRFHQRKTDAQWLWAAVSLAATGLYLICWGIQYLSVLFASRDMLDYKYVFKPPLFATNYHFRGEGLGQGEVFGLWDNIINCILNVNEHGTVLYSAMIFFFLVASIWGIIFISSYRHDMKRVYMFLMVHVAVYILLSLVGSSTVASRVCVTAVPIALAYTGIDLFIRQRQAWICTGMVAVVLAGLFLWCPHNNVRDFANYKKVYDYLLSKKAEGEKGIVAGSLSVVEGVPFFCQWEAYFMSSWAIMPKTEPMNAWLSGRKDELFYILYGGREALTKVDAFISKNTIRYLILDERYLNKHYVMEKKDGGMTGLFLSDIKKNVEQYNREGIFPLMELAKKYAVVWEGPVYVVPAGALQEALREMGVKKNDISYGR